MALLLILVVLVLLVGELGVNWSSRSSLWTSSPRVGGLGAKFFFRNALDKAVGAQALKAVWILSSLYGRTALVSTFSWH